MLIRIGWRFRIEEKDVKAKNNDRLLAQVATEETGTNPSASSMMVTMLLLIAGFAFCSMTIFLQTLKQTASTEGGEQKWPFDWISINATHLAQANKADVTNGPHSTFPGFPGASSITDKLLPPPRDGSVRWPKLELIGFGRAGDGSGSFAIINGQKISVGEHIGKVKLVEIVPGGAVVECQGEQKTLSVHIALQN